MSCIVRAVKLSVKRSSGHAIVRTLACLLACRAPERSVDSAVAVPIDVATTNSTTESAQLRVDSPNADAGAPPDLLTFAHGAIPLRVGGSGAGFGATFEEAVEAIDGSSTPYAMVRSAPADTVTEFVFELPAATTFSHFEVPRIHEVPSKFTTFTRDVEIHGSAISATDGFVPLASATLSTHTRDDEVTVLELGAAPTPVRWVKLRLGGGISVQSAASNLEFSEIVGHGSQDTPPRLDRFGGRWRTRGAAFDLRQDGPLVSGCYDDVGELDGTVTGNILRARGTAKATGVVSAFVLTVMPDGELRGLRSTNGAPFRLITSAPAAANTPSTCPRTGAPTLGCGSIIHGIGFAFDSATIRDDAEPVLARLYTGLGGTTGSIRVEGHTSSEGTDAHNRELSRRRAQAVVDDLIRRGLPRDRVTAVGRGPDVPIADNGDEAGRSLNRRVEIHCDGP